jgi:hypothetical protein
MAAASIRDWAGLVAVASMTVVGCGSTSAEVAATSDGGAPSTDDAGPVTTGDGGVTAPPACRSDAIVQALGACIDQGTAPRACLAKVRVAGEAACDVDDDGLDDALEDAMLRSYAPVFAFNKGNGDHTAGDSEPNFPDNARHYVSGSTLYWRVDGDDTTKKVVDAKPTLDGLRDARFDFQGDERRADQVKLGHGPNFWLCLNQTGGKYSSDAVVGSMEISRKLSGGIDVFAVAHPSGSDRDGRYVALQYMLLFAYNTFSLDDHEGDFEGGAVFVDTETGKVAALYADRHPTSDGTMITPLEGPGRLSAKDPTKESPRYNVCSDTDTDAIGGVRFWDHGGERHHPVLYMSAGSHASYAYPGATKIQGAPGCIEQTIIRDVHNGLGPKLAPHENAYFTDWAGAKVPVEQGVHIVNLGERAKLRAEWSAFAGQWGCTLSSIPKSYPGPWDNERLCRHWLTDDWGPAPPFARPAAKGCSP